MYQQAKRTYVPAKQGRAFSLEDELQALCFAGDQRISRNNLLELLIKYGLPRRVGSVKLRRMIESGVLQCAGTQCGEMRFVDATSIQQMVVSLNMSVKSYNSRVQEVLQIQYGIEASLIEMVVKKVTPDKICRLQKLTALLKNALHSEQETILVLREFYEELFDIASNAMLSSLSAQMISFFEEGHERYIADATNRKTIHSHVVRVVRYISEFDEVGACATVRGQLARMGTYYSVYFA